MEWIKLSNRSNYNIDYNSPELSDAFRNCRPIIYKHGLSYFCLSGPNPVEGIFGCGNSAEEAVEEWETAYAKRNLQK